MHAATRKRRLVNRLIRKVNKLTAEAQYWRKRAKKLASGAIEVEDEHHLLINRYGRTRLTLCEETCWSV